jgi:hypothetical protein
VTTRPLSSFPSSGVEKNDLRWLWNALPIPLRLATAFRSRPVLW